MKHYYTLNNGVKIPAIGFGTWQIPDGPEAYNATLAALKAGYRHIDTAMVYGNEKSVGRAIKDSGINREEIFVTTKLSAMIKGYDEALAEFEKSLANLGLDYIDLYLIHNVKPWESKATAADTWMRTSLPGKRSKSFTKKESSAPSASQISCLGIWRF